MKKMLVLVLMLLMVTTSALAVSPYDLDAVFLQYGPDVSWQRSISRDEISVSINEKAMIDGHQYLFHVEGDNNSVACVTLEGWYADLQISGRIFPTGLDVYNRCLEVLEKWFQRGRVGGFTQLIDTYDIYTILKYGETDRMDYNGWSVVGIAKNTIEIMGNGFISVTKQASGGFVLYASEF